MSRWLWKKMLERQFFYCMIFSEYVSVPANRMETEIILSTSSRAKMNNMELYG